jgi:hypothetical protein
MLNESILYDQTFRRNVEIDILINFYRRGLPTGNNFNLFFIRQLADVWLVEK